MLWSSLKGLGGDERPEGQEIRQLLITDLGSLWVVTERGLSRLGNGRFEHFNRKTGLREEQIFQLAAAGRGVVAATKGGLVWIEDQPPATDAETGAAVETSCGETPRVLQRGVVLSVGFDRRRLWYLKADVPTSLGSYQVEPQGCLERAGDLKTGGPLRSLLTLGPGNLVGQGEQLDWHALDLTRGKLIEPLVKVLFSGPHTVAGSFVLVRDGVARWVEGQPFEDKPIEAPLGEGRGSLALGDGGKRLWVGRKGMVHEVDVETRELRRSLRLPNEDIVPTALAEDKHGRLWVGSESELLVADLERTRVLDWPTADEKEKEGQGAHSGPGEIKSQWPIENAGFAEDGRVWLASGDELVLMDPDTRPPRKIDRYAPKKGEVQGAWVGKEFRISTSQGVFRRAGDGWELIQPSYQLTRQDLEELERRDELADFWLGHPETKALVSASPFGALRQWDLEDRALREVEGLFGGGIPESLLPINTVKVLASNERTIIMAGSRPPIRTSVAYWVYENARVDDLVFRPRDLGVRSVVQQARGDAVLALARRGMLYQIEGANWRLKPSPSLWNARLLASSEAEGGVFSVTDRSVRRSNSGGEWKSLATAYTGLPYWGTTGAIRGILPDPSGDGALVGCSGCDARFAHVTANGQSTPLPIPVDGVGGGDNALLRDSRGDEWISTDDTLFVRRGRKAALAPVRRVGDQPLEVRADSIIEDPQGWIWFSTGGFASDEGPTKAGVWFIPPGMPLQKILTTGGDLVVLALAHAGKTKGLRIWVGGEGKLRAIHRETLTIEDYSDEVQQVLGRPSGVYRLQADGDGLLALMENGLVRMVDGHAEKVPLASWQGGWDSQNVIALRRFQDGRALVAVALDDSTSRVWLRPAGQHDFTLLGEAPLPIHSIAESATGKVLMGAAHGVVFTIRNDRHIIPQWRLLEEQAQWRMLDKQFQRHGLPQQSSQRVLGQYNGRFVGSFRGVCPLESGEALVLTASFHAYVIDARNQQSVLDLPQLLPAWKNCVSLDSSRYLLQHETQVTMLSRKDKVPRFEEVPLVSGDDERLMQLARSGEGTKGDIVALGAKRIWHLDRAALKFQSLTELPYALTGDTESLILAVGAGHVWLGTPGSGLWAYPLPQGDRAPSFAPRWETWEESKGLPSSFIQALLVTTNDEILIFTQEAARRARFVDQKLQFKELAPPGVAGQKLRAATVTVHALEASGGE